MTQLVELATVELYGERSRGCRLCACLGEVHKHVVIEARIDGSQKKASNSRNQGEDHFLRWRVGIRAIAESHGIGKTQVSNILRNKVSIKAAYASNISTRKKCRVSKYSDVNEALYSWYKLREGQKDIRRMSALSQVLQLWSNWAVALDELLEEPVS